MKKKKRTKKQFKKRVKSDRKFTVYRNGKPIVESE